MKWTRETHADSSVFWIRLNRKIPIEFPNDDSFNDMQLITGNVMHL